MGGKKNQFTFINDMQRIHGQHDIRRIDNGNITLFDNGTLMPLRPATAKEYTLDENTLTATLVWSYVENPAAYSQSMGNMQRLPNGNTLVNYGNSNIGAIAFNVVDPAGNKTFELVFDDSLATYRAFNFTPTWQLPTTISEPAKNIFSVYPNPFSDYLSVNLKGDFEIQLTNIFGQEITTQKGKDALIISTTRLPSNIYFIRAKSAGRFYVFKLVKTD
jgi:hypothetical protein